MLASRSTPSSIHMLGMPLARVSENGLVDFVFEQLANGQGGWLITANLD